MSRIFCSVVFALTLASTVSAQKPQPVHTHPSVPGQDATVQLPANFKREFENDWVDVTRAHYDANSKLPAHEHLGGISVYLYLNASDGVVYSHVDGDAMVPRRPVVAGGIRVGDTPHEYHTVVNNASTPSDFIRVLLKTQTHEKVPHAAGRLRPVDASYDHAFLKVNRVNVPPHTRTRIEATSYPMLRMAAIPGYPDWKMAATGTYQFLEKGTTEEFENTGDVSIQLVTIELKSKLVPQPKK